MFRTLVFTCCALLSACQHIPAPLSIDQLAECPINLAPGQLLSLTLPSQPSTGYRWHLNSQALTGLKLLSHAQHMPKQPELVGAMGQSVWQFQALEPATGYLALSYQRPWEAEPVESFECLIQINLH